MNTSAEGLVYAYLGTAEGNWRSLDWAEVIAWQPGQGLIWVHLDATSPGARRYLHEHSGLDRLAQDALLEEETRPRTVAMGDSLLTILRGVNLNPGADPNDLVSVRLWAESRLCTRVALRREGSRARPVGRPVQRASRCQSQPNCTAPLQRAACRSGCAVRRICRSARRPEGGRGTR